MAGGGIHAPPKEARGLMGSCNWRWNRLVNRSRHRLRLRTGYYRCWESPFCKEREREMIEEIEKDIMSDNNKREIN